MDAANSGYKEGLDTGSSITNPAHKTMFPNAPRKTTNRLQGIRTAVAKMGGPGSYGVKVPATDDGMKKGGRTKKADGGPTEMTALQQLIKKGEDAGTRAGEKLAAQRRLQAQGKMSPNREAAMARGDMSGPNLNYFDKPFKMRAAGGKAMHHEDCSCKMCSGGMAYRSKKFDGGGITGMNPMMQPGTTQPNMMLRPPLGQAPGMGQSPMGQGPFNPMGNRPMRASGGRAQPILDDQRLRELHRMRESRNSMEGIDNFGDYGRSRRMDSHGAFMRNYHENMKNDMDKKNASLTSSGLKRGGRSEKCWGGETKARPHRASGGRTKGKTNVNIIISPQSGQPQGPLGAGVGMGQPPVPPMMPPTPPMGGMPPGMPPMMPPAPPMGGAPGGGLPPQLMAALAGRGGMPPMARKSGGRVGHKMPKYQEEDYGSGSGLGRLEKRKWPTANGTE
jgi:hypothetical protein